MILNRTNNPLSRIERNKLNNNWDLIERGVSDANWKANNSLDIANALITNAFDDAALKANIEQKLNDLETQYAPQLTNITEQLADNEKENRNLISNLRNFFDSSKANLILLGIDSLTNNTDENSYYGVFSPRIKGELGYGGPGYIPFNPIMSEYGDAFQKSDALSYINQSSAVAPYSFDLKGVFTESGSGTDYVKMFFNRKWLHGKVFYLKQPGGGTFKIGYDSQENANLTTINTSNETYDLGVFTFPDNVGLKGGNIKCMEIIGKVALFGGLFLMDSGVATSRIGKPGDLLTWHASTAFRNKWLTELKPSLLMLNGGMNDRLTTSKEQYRTILTNYLNDFNSANCKIVLIKPNEISSGNDILREYEKVIDDVSVSLNTNTISNRAIIGTYSDAVKNGLMSDTIHPNKKANSKLGNAYLQMFGIPLIGKADEGKVETTGGNSVFQPKHELTPKTFELTSGTSKVAYKIGLTNQYPAALVELDVIGLRKSLRGSVQKKLKMVIANSTLVNNVSTTITGLTITEQFRTSDADNVQVEFNLTANVVNGKLEIMVSPNTGSATMSFYTEGTVKFMYLYSTGQSVFEN